MNLVTTAASTALSFMLPKQQLQPWTILDESGSEIVSFTSFLSMEFRNEVKVVDGAVEEGSFATYNKVATPREFSVSLGIEGDNAALQEALDALEALAEGTDIVSLVTPDYEYRSITLEGFSYQRKRENGVGVLFVDLEFVEIRQVEAQYTNVRLGKKKSRGKVQAETSALAGLSSWIKG